MPPRSPEPLQKVTFNLFAKDCEAMERRYGHGWSERIRLMVREHLNKLKQPSLDEIEMFVEEDLDARD
jgi:hypothetical protein